MAKAGVVLLTFRTSGTEAAARNAEKVGDEVQKSGGKAERGAKGLATFTGALDTGLGKMLPFDTGLGQVSSSLDKFAGDLGGSGSKLKLWGAGLAGAAVGVGVAVGAALVSGVTKAIQLDEARREVTAQLGLTEPESQKVGAAAGHLFASAYGESVTQVSQVVGQVVGSIEGMRDASQATLENMSRDVLNFSKAFEQDTGRATQVVGQLLTTGLAKDADEAMDLLTASMQAVPANVRDDVMDAADEYGPFFSQLGLDGATAFGLLAEGSKQGMYGIDKTGDALKELTIRSTDMSKNSIAAYEAMGLDAQDMANKMLAGGETASDAFGQIVDGLLNIEDPSQQANAAISLMGTPLEDLGTAKIPGFLESLRDGTDELGDFKGAADDLDDTLNNGPTRGFEKMGRAWGGVLTQIGQELLPGMQGASDAVGGWADSLLDSAPAIADTVGDMLDGVGEFGETIAPIFEALFDPLSQLIGPLLELWQAFSPMSLIFKAIEPVLPVLVDAFTTLADTLGGALLEVLTQVLDAAMPVAEMLSGFLADAVVQLMPVILALVDGLGGALGDVLIAIAPLLGMIAQLIGQVLQMVLPLIPPILDLVMAFMPLVDVVIQLISFLLPPLIEFLTFLLPVVFALIEPILDLAVNAIGVLVGWLTTAVEWVAAVYQWFADLVTGAGSARDNLASIWQAISDAFGTAWGWIQENVFQPFLDGIDSIVDGFDVAVDAIGKAWDGIKEAAAVPINFVLGTIWNDGLRSFWNDVVGALGLDNLALPKAPLVEFATGGVMPGYTPGRDVHQFYSPTAGRLALSGGEAIMRPEFTRAMGGEEGIARLNAAARAGNLDTAHFSLGGIFGTVTGAIGDFASGVWDTVKSAADLAVDFVTDPAAAIQDHVIDGILRPLLANDDANIFLKAVGELPIELVSGLVGAFDGATAPEGSGSAGMGWEAMWAMVQKADPSITMTSNYRPGSMTVNGTPSLHGQGRAIDLIPASMDTFNLAKRLFPNATELIYTPAGAGQLYNGKSFTGWSEAVKAQHYNHIHVAMNQGGVMPGLPALANGGPVKAGEAYVVGDGGVPELFVPGADGYVYPQVPQLSTPSAADIDASLDDVDVVVGSGGDGPTVIQVVMPDGKVLLEQVLDEGDDEGARL